ncbi:hypothetical protein TNCV_886851 [Trichonephila clavipes]|uniref:Uncharacterized protein n=1 Tax=Trichonephila clavipes TaxID=2585209 RepID=A0A8X6UZS1_TRICX|nr:hypothetical protein TNCV_886851 [Trichonephila clavipes]
MPRAQQTYYRQASHDRSISVLNRENDISTMGKEKLDSWLLLCTQNEITIQIDYNDVINDFAMIKARRKPLLYKCNDSDSTKNKDV